MITRRSVTGDILDDRIEYSLGDLCRVCAVDAETVIDMVAEGVVEPNGENPQHWRFTGRSVLRVQTAIRLQRDLRVNLPGVALALDLLEELEELRRRRRGL